MDYLHESAASVYRRRRRHRAVATMTLVSLILVSTVVYAASYVQGWIGTPAPQAVSNANCYASNQKLTPSGVTINVYNGTSRVGLAASVATSLERAGFKVATVDNDPLGRTVLSLAEVRHGQSGTAAAALAATRLPGATFVQDTRVDASVDLVLGKKFRSLSSSRKAATSKKVTLATHC